MTAKGELERSVLEVLWSSPGAMTAKEVIPLLPRQDLALTTILTVLERLRAKDLVARSEGGRPYSYQATMTRDEFIATTMLEALGQAPDRDATLTHFLGAIRTTDAEHLRTILTRSRNSHEN
ncbi:MAG: BlaI/MecI/CopY family transcriptional regulator [Acidimicrobiales bacterium]